MSLATTGEKNIWAAAVFYVNRSLNLFFLSSPSSRHGENLSACPEVSATVHEDYRDWRVIKGIQLEGVVELIEGEERDEAMRLYGQKFPIVGESDHMPPEIASALCKVGCYRLTPRRMYFINNSIRFGHREEVRL